MMINPKYATSILTLANTLSEHNIPHTVHAVFDGLQLRFPWCAGDIICHSGSYGHSGAHVESYCFPWDNGDCTELTITEAVELLTDFYAEIGA